MKDILGREINIGDLVLTKATGKWSKPMRIGIWNGKSVTYKNYTGICDQLYLIENPVQQELDIKNAIIEQQEKCEENAKKEKEERMSKKKIPQKELIVGQTYLDDKDYKWLYLGKGTVNTYIQNKGEYNYKLKEEETGFVYIKLYSDSKNEFRTIEGYSVVKIAKRLVEKIDNIINIDLDNLTFEGNHYSYYVSKKKIEFKLDK